MTAAFFSLDADDAADLKRESAQRKAERAICTECGCRGHHLTGCPEQESEDEGSDE